MPFNVLPCGIPEILSFVRFLETGIPQTTALSKGRMLFFCHCRQCHILGITALATTCDGTDLAALWMMRRLSSLLPSPMDH
jgi:hypothetical protein